MSFKISYYILSGAILIFIIGLILYINAPKKEGFLSALPDDRDTCFMAGGNWLNDECMIILQHPAFKQKKEVSKTTEIVTTPVIAPPIVPQQVFAPPIVPQQVIAPPIVPPQVIAPPVVPRQVIAPPVAPPQVIAPPVAPVPVVSPYVNSKILLNGNCQKGSGWSKELGIGTHNVTSDFPADASYITVPTGLTAKIFAPGGEQIVNGPGEFNFCGRGGFNDVATKIIVSPDAPISSTPISSTPVAPAPVPVAPQPVVSPYVNSKIILNANCQKGSGWSKELGIGTHNVTNDFPADASYITVPTGLTAKISAPGGEQIVNGPGEFNFCGRGGFNDAATKINVSPIEMFSSYMYPDPVLSNTTVISNKQPSMGPVLAPPTFF